MEGVSHALEKNCDATFVEEVLPAGNALGDHILWHQVAANQICKTTFDVSQLDDVRAGLGAGRKIKVVSALKKDCLHIISICHEVHAPGSVVSMPILVMKVGNTSLYVKAEKGGVVQIQPRDMMNSDGSRKFLDAAVSDQQKRMFAGYTHEIKRFHMEGQFIVDRQKYLPDRVDELRVCVLAIKPPSEDVEVPKELQQAQDYTAVDLTAIIGLLAKRDLSKNIDAFFQEFGEVLEDNKENRSIIEAVFLACTPKSVEKPKLSFPSISDVAFLGVGVAITQLANWYDRLYQPRLDGIWNCNQTAAFQGPGPWRNGFVNN